MMDIRRSLLAGIQSAKTAVNNIAEIERVLNSTARQIEEISGRKATFGIGTFSEKSSDSSAFGVGMALLRTYTQSPVVSYEALAIFDIDGSNGDEIAVWTQHEDGYPCSVAYNSQKLYCANKAELENVLSDLLKETKTGKAILSRMSK